MATSIASRIAPGTRLRQRYLIREVQRQTPYVSTYLALDQERFNRPCTLTEFPLLSDNAVTQDMLLDRFRQTAVPLFQLNHPQLPQFSAAFRHQQSLFLAQNHAEGVSYRELLNLRHRLDRTLTEPEVLHLLMHLLPVLDELHQRNIIHGRISPDCILIPAKPPKSADELHLLLQHEAPLLVGLGTVEQLGQTLATLQDGRNASAALVSQPGYAPPEQLQTGRLSPSCDLYALAVTSLVLLTGRSPQDLLDSQTLNWSWQSFVSLSHPFEMLLEQMLAWQPGDRYPNAKAALPDVQEAFHYINLHSSVAPAASKAFPLSTQQLTVDSLLPKSASRAIRAKLPVQLPPALAQAADSDPDPLEGSLLSYDTHGTMRSNIHPASPRKYPAHPQHRSPNGWEISTVLGLSFGAVVAAGAMIGFATGTPLNALSSDRSTWLQRMAEVSLNWSELSWPEVKLSAPTLPEFSEWSANLPSLRRGQTKSTTDETASGGLASEKLDFGQPMLSDQRSVETDTAAIREAELQALKQGLDDIDIPIYFPGDNQTQTLMGTLYELRNQSYMLVAEPGQILRVELDAVDAELTVLDSWQHPIDLDAELTQEWQGELPGGDHYFIKVSGKGDYRLNVQLFEPKPFDSEPLDAEQLDSEQLDAEQLDAEQLELNSLEADSPIPSGDSAELSQETPATPEAFQPSEPPVNSRDDVGIAEVEAIEIEAGEVEAGEE